MNAMDHLMTNAQIVESVIRHVSDQFQRTYLKGIPLLHNDNGAFLSFTCCLMAIESLGAFMKPKDGNGDRFKTFVDAYFPEPLRSQREELWKFRNAMVHAFSPGPYVLTHYNRNSHLSTQQGRTVLNAEDFYEVVAQASARYFDALTSDAQLRSAFIERVGEIGVVMVLPLGQPSA